MTIKKYILGAFVFPLAVLFFSFFFVSMHDVSAAEVTLAWDMNPEPIVQGYRVYYGTSTGFYMNVVDAGNKTNCVVTGLAASTTYFFACTAYSATGDESNFSNEVVYTTQGGSSESSGSGCFIAMAAYGSEFAAEVIVLREFKDRLLMSNRLGQTFVDYYYRVSPPVAAFISEQELLKTAVRWALTPLVYGIKYPLLLLYGVCCVAWLLVGRRFRW